MACFYHSEATHRAEFGTSRSFGDRLFDINEYAGMTCPITTENSNFTLLVCPTECCQCHQDPSAHNDAIVIATDGACSNNRYHAARMAYGVFFHPNSSWNTCGVIGSVGLHTNQRAELHAAGQALIVVRSIREQNPMGPARLNIAPGPARSLRRVVIKSDSDYLVKGMTDWIYRWKRNSFVNQKGAAVVNADLFQDLDQSVEELNDLGVEVQFWHVPRARNVVADHLAKSALNGLSADEALYVWYS